MSVVTGDEVAQNAIVGGAAHGSGENHVCVSARKLEDGYSETFIKNHVRFFGENGCQLRGRGWTHGTDGRPIDRPGRVERLRRRILRRLAGASAQRFHREAVVRYLKDNAVEVMLAEYGQAGAALLPFCEAAEVPLVVHFHGFDAFVHEELERNAEGYRRMFENAAAVIGVSRDMRQQLIDLGAPAERTVYLPYGVDVERFRKASPGEAPPHFLAVGRFVEKKAPLLTVLAFARVLEAVPEARLTMAGDGVLRGPTQQLAKALGVDHAVAFPGVMGHDDVAAYMRRSRAFVQHSIRSSTGDAEGTPVAVLEAQTSGLPVVATRHMGIKDVVIEGETGILVDEQDVEGMAEGMLTMARDADAAARFGEAARLRAHEQFMLNDQLRKLAAVLEAAAHGKPIPTYV